MQRVKLGGSLLQDADLTEADLFRENREILPVGHVDATVDFRSLVVHFQSSEILDAVAL